MLSRRIAVVVVSGLLTGCATGSGSGPAAGIESTEFAPALGIELELMTRLSSGLYLRDVVEGSGSPARAGQRVALRYITWLPDGRQLDDNVGDPGPLEFQLGRGVVIRGWEQGIAGMRPGGQRMLVVPPALAYGRSGRGAVPPDAVLVFLIELLGVR
jgi:FKBP-type peptidyl-prolyl cis-trans isomerase FkpA